MKLKRIRKIVLMGVLVLGVMALGGCGSDREPKTTPSAVEIEITTPVIAMSSEEYSPGDNTVSTESTTENNDAESETTGVETTALTSEVSENAANEEQEGNSSGEERVELGDFVMPFDVNLADDQIVPSSEKSVYKHEELGLDFHFVMYENLKENADSGAGLQYSAFRIYKDDELLKDVAVKGSSVKHLKYAISYGDDCYYFFEGTYENRVVIYALNVTELIENGSADVVRVGVINMSSDFEYDDFEDWGLAENDQFSGIVKATKGNEVRYYQVEAQFNQQDSLNVLEQVDSEDITE